MTALIVEDSRLARREIHRMLTNLGHFDDILEAATAEAAIDLLDQQPVDLLLLDIHLPGMNGFDLLEHLDEAPPTIFTTAYDQYAVRSFEYNAIDYLLKPVKASRLEQAVNKVLDRFPPEREPTKQIFIRDGERCWFARVEDIRLVESVGNYARLYFNGERALLHRSLNHLEGVLDPDNFFRANRQQLISLRHLDRLEPWFNDRLKVYLRGGEVVEVSRRGSQRLRERFTI